MIISKFPFGFQLCVVLALAGSGIVHEMLKEKLRITPTGYLALLPVIGLGFRYPGIGIVIGIRIVPTLAPAGMGVIALQVFYASPSSPVPAGTGTSTILMRPCRDPVKRRPGRPPMRQLPRQFPLPAGPGAIQAPLSLDRRPSPMAQSVEAIQGRIPIAERHTKNI